MEVGGNLPPITAQPLASDRMATQFLSERESSFCLEYPTHFRWLRMMSQRPLAPLRKLPTRDGTTPAVLLGELDDRWRGFFRFGRVVHGEAEVAERLRILPIKTEENVAAGSQRFIDLGHRDVAIPIFLFREAGQSGRFLVMRVCAIESGTDHRPIQTGQRRSRAEGEMLRADRLQKADRIRRFRRDWHSECFSRHTIFTSRLIRIRERNSLECGK